MGPKWNWKTLAPWIVVGLLFAGAVTGVIYGVATHEEPGLANPEARWDHSPLTVTCVPYAGPESDACDTVEDVVSVVNHRLGYEALAWRGRRVQGSDDIEVVTRAPVEVGDDGPCGQPGECFVLTGSGGVYDRCSVRTMNVSGGAGNLEWLVTYHGLGHCLGLAHDGYDQSIMRGTQSATPSRTIPPWISDFDRALLRGLYAE